MMKMNIAITQSIFKLGPLDFAWKQIQIISTDDKNDDDDDVDDDSDNDINDDDDNDNHSDNKNKNDKNHKSFESSKCDTSF